VVRSRHIINKPELFKGLIVAKKRQPSVPQVGLDQAGQDEAQKLAERAARRAERRARASAGRSALREGMTGNRREESSSARALDHAKVREMLANPTKQVSDEDLKREYAHVLDDIRNMLLLSGGLLVFMVILGNVI
jgi:hypothetical protein